MGPLQRGMWVAEGRCQPMTGSSAAHAGSPAAPGDKLWFLAWRMGWKTPWQGLGWVPLGVSWGAPIKRRHLKTARRL